MSKEIKDETIKAYALKNAVEHEGKAAMGSVVSGLFAEGLKKEDVKDIMMRINFIVSEVNKMGPDFQKEEFAKLEKFIGHREVRSQDELPELPNVPKTGVIMRFAPAPSGPLHIGHIIANMSSSLYVKRYGGKFYVRIEDTNPEKTLAEAYENIKIDCNWLFGNVTEYIIQSDRLAVYYKYAEDLIKKESAYVCTCDSEKFKKLVDKSKPCHCRSNSLNDNLERWNKMLDKNGFKEGEAVLRFKSDIMDPNPAMRDFPLARINETKHPRQGNKYRVWPLMNLSVTVDDIEYGMTHIIRGKDHKDNAERQKKIYKVLGLEKKFPVTLFIGRVKFDDMILSKRKLTAALQEGEFEGASDVRLPTWSSLRNRGFQPEAFAKMAIKKGISEVDKVMSSKDYFDELSNFNREVIKDRAILASFEANKKGKIKILMPDATLGIGDSEIDLNKIKDGDIIFFRGLGYCRFNQNEKISFWFTHK